MSTLLAFIATLAFIVGFALYYQYNRISIRHVPGPPSSSFLLGHLPELQNSAVGETELKWQTKYGDVVRIQGPFGEDRLLVVDPKALHHIFHISGYSYTRPSERRQLLRLLIGRSLFWAEGEDHKRHRKVLLPAFGAPEAKTSWPIFSYHAQKVVAKWKEMVVASPDQIIVVNARSHISRALLDAIGEATLDYQFGTMDDRENELGKVWHNLLVDTFGILSGFFIFVQSILGYLPFSAIFPIAKYMPGPSLDRIFEADKVCTRIAQTIIATKLDDPPQDSRNVLGILAEASSSGQMNDEELCAQIKTLMLSGHETSANTLSWALLELARCPEIQKTLRTEIREREKQLKVRGQTQFTPGDVSKMPYLQAVIKEVLRFHPVFPTIYRQAGRDDVLPLSKPITTASGEAILELPIPKGLEIYASVNGYNRNKDIFGDDAHVFNPNRWLEGVKTDVNLGIYSNLFSFGAGVKACIGFRFALVELQVCLIELVNNLEFATNETTKVRRLDTGSIMSPVIEGEVEAGAQLPLQMTLASRGE